MDPYYEHMHMYGSVPKGKGVDRNMNQFYGRKSLGNASLGGVGPLTPPFSVSSVPSLSVCM